MATVVPELFSKAQSKILVLVLACLASAIFARAQTSPPLTIQKTAATPTSATPPDLLGRETPRGTVIGFVRNAQDENYEVAVKYFQPASKGHHTTFAEEQELAEQLLAVLNAKFPTSALDSISRDPDGRGDDGQPHDEIKVGGTRGLSESFPLYLVRLEDAHGNKLWLISRQTLEQVPEVYDSLRFPQIEKRLPQFLVAHRPLGMPLWQWIAIILFAPVALVLGRVVALVSRVCWQWIRRTRGLEPLPGEPLRRFGPGALLVAAIIHYNFVYLIGTSLLYRQYYRQAIWVFLAFAFYWAVTRITHRISRDISQRLADRGLLAERSDRTSVV
jgi:MscS family membrane protein